MNIQCVHPLGVVYRTCVYTYLFQSVYSAEVKKGITCFGGMLMPPAKARRLIADTAAEAYRHAADIRPLVWDSPVSFRVEVTERSQLPSALGKPYMTVIDGRTYEVTGDSMAEAFFRSL